VALCCFRKPILIVFSVCADLLPFFFLVMLESLLFWTPSFRHPLSYLGSQSMVFSFPPNRGLDEVDL